MNKTISVNISGLSFFIEENAYNKLHTYLENVRISLQDEDDVDEIMKDVESRIAELFKEWLGNFRQVIDLKDINNIIDIMGKPEQYYPESENTDYKTKNYQKQLFRDPDDRIVGGVCSGLSHFFGVQTTWFRIILIIFIILVKISHLGIGGIIPLIIMIYIILWIITPTANTTSEKLMMKGEPVNFDSIKQYINKNDVKNKITFTGNKIGNFIEKFLKILIKVSSVLLGCYFIILSISLIISYFLLVFSISPSSSIVYDYLNIFITTQWHLYLFMILSGVIIIIPTLFLLLLGLRLLTHKRIFKISTPTVIIISSAWIISCFISLILVGIVASEYNTNVERKNKFIINTPSDTIKINMFDNNKIFSYENKIGINPDNIRVFQDSIYINTNKHLEIRPSLDNNTYMELEYSASGNNYNNAYKNTLNLNDYTTLQNNTINTFPYISLQKNLKFRNQNIKKILYLPKNKYVITKGIDQIIYNNNTIYDKYEYQNNIDNPNILFKFDGKFLNCISCNDNSLLKTYE